ncbi:MAG: AsmA-like C-terminal region-containing protein [Cytophagales bacterium]|nr:AsmA-like C-terminal region-containing protein [Cytophagales bacterium]
MKKFLIKSLLALLIASSAFVLMSAGFLYGWVVPHLDDWRPRIEAYLSKQIGRTVQLDNITAKASGVLPSFDLKGIRVLDAQGATALQLGRVQVSFSPISLLTFEMNQLIIDAPTIEVVRDAAGMVTVAGFPMAKSKEPSKGLEWLLTQKEITVQGGTVHWTDALPHVMGRAQALPSATFSQVAITLKNGPRSHNIALQATPPVALGQSFQMTGAFTQPLLELRASHWQVWTGSLQATLEPPRNLAKQFTAELTLPAQKLLATGTHVPFTALPLLADIFGHPLAISTDQRAALKGAIERITIHLQDASNPMTHIRAEAVFTSPDATGNMDVTWQEQGALMSIKSQLASLDLTAVARYLPSHVPPAIKQSLQTSLQKGMAKNVTVLIKGSAENFPFADAKTGTMQIDGKLADVQFAWDNLPALTQAHATFSLKASTLALDDINAVIAGIPTTGSLRIADLRTPVIDLGARAKGNITQLLEFLNTHTVKALSRESLAGIQGSGLAEAQLHLSLPLANPAQSKVAGSIQFANNSLTLGDAFPPLTALSGKLTFEKANRLNFQLRNVQATVLGGPIQLTGNQQLLTGQGTAKAEALKAWASSELAGALQTRIQGTLPYQFSVDLQGGGISLESSLVGLQVDLPAPFTKPADATWLLRYGKSKLSPTEDHVTLSIAHLASAELIRSIPSAKVLRGHISLGAVDSQPMLPEQGVSAYVHLEKLDLDAWRQFMPTASKTPSANLTTSTYLPQQIAAEIGTLRVANRDFAHIVLGASKLKDTWRINAEATNFSGYAEYRSPATQETGQFYARLQRLTLPDTDTKSRIEKFLQEAPPSSLPALDVVVDEFELIGKKIGRIEISAVNQRAKSYLGKGTAQEWRLEKLNITNPESELKATGVWTPADERTASRRVDLQFNLDVADSGALLTRFGQPGTLKDGKGNLQGRIAWMGSPLALHYPTLTGQIKLDMTKGQFLKVDPGSGGRFLSVLSLQALPRLLQLDFRDVFSDGFAFDSVAGDAKIIEGVLSSDNLQMKSVLALVSLNGSVDLAKETQQLHVRVLPDINAGGVSLLATLINPIVGAATYLTQLILRRPVVAANTKEFQINGSWRDPQVIQIKKK